MNLLLCCGDIETNPGPVSQDSEKSLMEAITEAIKNSEKNLSKNIKDIHTEMTNIKTEMRGLKDQFDQIKQDVENIQTDQLNVIRDVESIKKDITNIKEKGENLQLDIDQVSDDIQQVDIKLTDINERLETLERNSIRSNMRIFNMPYSEGEDRDINLRKIVIDRVLKPARLSINWRDDDLKYVKRIGESRDGRQPLMVVSFEYDDGKLRVYHGRATLRERQIRVGDDLTKSQRTTIQKLRAQGRWAYFHKGKLQIAERNGPVRNTSDSNTQEVNNNQTRVVKRAVRKLAPSTGEQEPEVMIIEDPVTSNNDPDNNDVQSTNHQ